ncbi:MAG TPA: hypothetical protein PKE27_00400 [Povalibacter sp.]|uniref:hypothetical protein n=1 Tax=Povalibacter sp. TaxID=1962978 RepID=UPI002C445D8C|nr:hypothetical protein [Povalibacter sp.]HMN43007.1 hypothetical protein [Povalibacter sp.]
MNAQHEISAHWMKHARHLCCIAALAMLSACGSEPEPPPPATPAAAPVQAAQPQPAAEAPADPTEKMARAVGNGKPGAAVDIKYEFAARPEPGKPVELEVVLIPSAGVDSMTAKFSGMDGITLAGDLTVDYASVTAKEPYKHSVSVLADRAGVFYVTVSVDTAISGATLGRTFAIPFVSGTPQVTQQKASVPATDSTGQPVEPMKAEETTR